MEKYRPKTALASLSDRVFRILVTCGIGIAWFVMLWGLCLPALTAGIALGGLIWLCVRQFSKRITARREKQMRRIIGGELALEKLLLMPPRHAAFQAAMWIVPRYPVVMQKAVEWGVIGIFGGKSVLIRLIAQHKSMPVHVQQVLECARELHHKKLEGCILCLTAPATKEALAFASAHDPPITIVSREELIDLAGLCSPASDEDLSRLGKQKRSRRSHREWLAVIFDSSRARRYFWYGLGLGLLWMFTGANVYPLPALICMSLFVGCKLKSFKHRHWTARSTP